MHAVAALFVDRFDRDMQRVAIPHAETHIVVRFGPDARRGLDVHALGAAQRVHRKLIRSGQRAVSARLKLGTVEAVLGVPATAIAGRIVALDELWGGPATERLCDRLAHARDTPDAARIVERAIGERTRGLDASSRVAVAAAERLTSTSVGEVAVALGLSERHLRRIFREAVGVSPKTFAKLARFHHAVRLAREERGATWAGIAAAAGYYDQAHLIAEFRTIAGVTPTAFLGELTEQRSRAA